MPWMHGNLQNLAHRGGGTTRSMGKGSRMRQPRAGFRVADAILGALALAGCAETELLVNTAKQAKGAGPRSVGPYKIGGPDPIAGGWHYRTAYWEYAATGKD